MKSLRFALLATVFSMPIAFANSNAGSKIYISSTNRETDAVQADYEAATWIEIKGVGSHGEAGTSTNILTYNTWDTDVAQKAKGVSDAGSPEIELARIPTDAGQVALRAAALTNLNYMFKLVRNDPATVGGTGTIIYNRGLVVGPKRPMGQVEDFDLEVFTLALNQREIVVAPTTGGTAPAFTALPAITGTATVGQTLSLSNGTVTGSGLTYAYQWFAGGTAVPGATANTFTLTSAQLGKIMQGRVWATNTAGSAQAMSGATAAVS